jgi:hypothetical protein
MKRSREEAQPPLTKAARAEVAEKSGSAAASREAEDEVLRQRLLAKETSLRNLTKKYLAFSAAIESASPEECEKLHQSLLKELAAYEFGMAKARTLVSVNVQQVASYEAMEGEIGAEMGRTADEIQALTQQLQEERTLRQRKEQYAALARRINLLPPRASVQREIDGLNEELGALREEGEALSARLAERSKLFAGFMHAVHDLELHLVSTRHRSPAPRPSARGLSAPQPYPAPRSPGSATQPQRSQHL